MRLTAITIQNFKSIPPEGVTISFRDGLVVLVGRNNAGKSNIVEAIGHLLGGKHPSYIEFPETVYHDLSKPIVIEARIEHATYTNGKQAGLSDAQCHGLMPTDRNKEPKPGSGCIQIRLEVPPPGMAETAGTTPDDGEEGEEPKRRYTLIVGPKTEIKRNIDRIRRGFVKYTVVPSARSEDKDLAPSTWTAYGRMLREILADSPRLGELQNVVLQATDALRGILQDEANSLKTLAKSTAYVDDLAFQFTKEGNPIELLRNLSIAVSYGGRTEDLGLSGTGTQSAVIIGVLELCLRYRAKSALRLFAVEEPELFLHPHAQRHIASLLRKISREFDCQVLLTTHSPAILADTDVLDVVRVDRSNEGTICRRVAADAVQLDEIERILNIETCEMLFADRVVLVEGPSEQKLLPRISPLVPYSTGGSPCDFDKLNTSVVPVGGKSRFGPFAALLNQFGISWRVIADNDALTGDSLATFKTNAHVTPDMCPDEQRKRLREVGVAVLSDGEIEDYYPIEALADLAGESPAAMQQRIEAARTGFETPDGIGFVEAVISQHQQEIADAKPERVGKLVQCWYSQTVQQLRDKGQVPQTVRKLGESLEKALGMNKPVIATKVARWIAKHPGKLPPKLANLVKWTVEGIIQGKAPQEHAE